MYKDDEPVNLATKANSPAKAASTSVNIHPDHNYS
jgi:hypothetical protein